MRFCRQRDRREPATRTGTGTGESIPVVALTPVSVVAGSVPIDGRPAARAIEVLSPIVLGDAIVMRLADGTVSDMRRVVLEPGRLIALGQTLPASRARIDKGLLVDVGPYVILAQLGHRVADLDAGRLMCRSAIVGFRVHDHWRIERLGPTRIEAGHARIVRTGTYEDFEVACTLRRVAAGC